MAKKSTKREFDWRTYSKPVRLLTPEQEAAFAEGPLRPLLDLARTDAGVSFEIRARQATLYYRGVSLVRVSGSGAELTAAIDATVRLPRAERPGAEQLETWPISTPAEVAALLGELATLRSALDEFAATEPASAREALLDFAAANRGDAAASELVVIDVEYQYGRRRFDFVAMRRAAGVGGAGAFTTPRLVIGELVTGHRPPTSATGLTSFGAEAAEFSHALSGEHLFRVKSELAELAAQRQRLGLSPETPLTHFADGMPELLAVFAEPGFAATAYDAPIAELHDRAIARHFPVERLLFAAVGASRPDGGDSLVVGEDDILPYRAFKGMRQRLRG